VAYITDITKQKVMTIKKVIRFLVRKSAPLQRTSWLHVWFLSSNLRPDTYWTSLAQKRYRYAVKQVAQLSQRNRAAGWVRFWLVVGDGVGHTILCTKRCRCQKLKALTFYTINPLLYEKWSLCVFQPLFGSLGAT